MRSHLYWWELKSLLFRWELKSHLFKWEWKSHLSRWEFKSYWCRCELNPICFPMILRTISNVIMFGFLTQEYCLSSRSSKSPFTLCIFLLCKFPQLSCFVWMWSNKHERLISFSSISTWCWRKWSVTNKYHIALYEKRNTNPAGIFDVDSTLNRRRNFDGRRKSVEKRKNISTVVGKALKNRRRNLPAGNCVFTKQYRQKCYFGFANLSQARQT